MLCQDEGLVIKTLRYSDYKLIAWIFTANHGLLPFMTSVDKKSSNIMNPGNIVELHWRKKNCSLLFAKCVVKLATTAHIIWQYREIKLLNVVLEVIGATVQEGNVHESFLYESVMQLVDALATNEPYEKQLLLYCCFELALLQDAGYGLQLSRCVATGSPDNLLYVSPKTGNAVSAEAGMKYKDRLLPYPRVLQHGTVSIAAIAEALQVCRYFMHKYFFVPYNKNMPNGRLLLESELEG